VIAAETIDLAGTVGRHILPDCWPPGGCAPAPAPSNGPGYRLAVLRHAEEVSGNVAATCRYYRISRNCYDKWLRLKDCSSCPHHSPRAAEVAGKILQLRTHCYFGPAKIAMYL
jgi:hypothetical protein